MRKVPDHISVFEWLGGADDEGDFQEMEFNGRRYRAEVSVYPHRPEQQIWWLFEIFPDGRRTVGINVPLDSPGALDDMVRNDLRKAAEEKAA